MSDTALRFLADESCYPGNARKSLQEAIIKLVHEQGIEIQNAFVVMQPGQIRVRRNK
jgi:hypothetical protein